MEVQCIDELNPYYNLLEFYTIEWRQIIFNKRFLLPQNTNKMKPKVRRGFRQLIFSCMLHDKSIYRRVILEREFLVIEKKKTNYITPFFTQEGGPEYRGGRLIHSVPPTIINEGFQPMFISVHLANVGRVFPFFLRKIFQQDVRTTLLRCRFNVLTSFQRPFNVVLCRLD